MGCSDICVSLLYLLYVFMAIMARSSVLLLATALPKISCFTRSFVNSGTHGEVTLHMTVTRRALLLNGGLTDVK